MDTDQEIIILNSSGSASINLPEFPEQNRVISITYLPTKSASNLSISAFEGFYYYDTLNQEVLNVNSAIISGNGGGITFVFSEIPNRSSQYFAIRQHGRITQDT